MTPYSAGTLSLGRGADDRLRFRGRCGGEGDTMVSVNERTPRPRRERVRSLGRGRPVVLWAGLAGVLVGMASAQEPESQLDLRDALRRAREKAASIKERVDAARDNPIVTYPSDLMEEIATFYREGVKDENAAAAAKVGFFLRHTACLASSPGSRLVATFPSSNP